MEIPHYIDEYNYNMGGVDIADQHRQAYATQRKSMRNWLPKRYWMIDHACINAFKIGVYSPSGHWTKKQHRDFRDRLWQELFQFAEWSIERKHTDMLGDTRLQCSEVDHVYAKLSVIEGVCSWCSYETRLARAKSRTPSPKKCCFGSEIDPNIPCRVPSDRARRIWSGCSRCGVFLCGLGKHDCWYRWHGLQPPEQRSLA